MEFNVECYKHFLNKAKMFNITYNEDVVDSLVGSRSGSLYTAAIA